MVADAKGIEEQVTPEPVLARQAAGFRGSFSGFERDRLFYNLDGLSRSFVQSGYVFGLDDDHDGRAAVPVDIDGDGDLDLALLTLRGLRLLENRSSPRHFVRVRLTATRSQADALGAHVTLTAGGVTRQDFVKITEGFRSQVPLDIHFGLGMANRVDTLEVRWPSGEIETWSDLEVDQLLSVTEDDSDVKASPLQRWPAGTRPVGTGSPSPEVVAQDLNGGMKAVAGGRPSVLNFWAPWCAPCNVELPQLVSLAARYQGEVDFVGLSVELSDIDSVREAINRFDIPYPQFLADEDVMAQFFGDSEEAVLPSTFVFDDQGQLRRVFRGAITEADLSGLLASFRDEGLSEGPLRFLAQAYFGSGDYERAVNYYEKLATLRPRRLNQVSFEWQQIRARDLAMVGQARRRLGNSADAIADLQSALRILGDDGTVLTELGMAAAEVGNLELAVDAFQRAVRVRPESVLAWIGKARVHRRRGEVAAARESYEQVLQLDRGNTRALRELADLNRGL